MQELKFEEILRTTKIENWARRQFASPSMCAKANIDYLKFVSSTNFEYIWNYNPAFKSLRIHIEDGYLSNDDGEFQARKILKQGLTKNNSRREHNIALFDVAAEYLYDQGVVSSAAFTNFSGVLYPIGQFDDRHLNIKIEPLTIAREPSGLAIYFIFPWTVEKLSQQQFDIFTSLIEHSFGRDSDLRYADMRVLSFPKTKDDFGIKRRVPSVVSRNDFVVLSEYQLSDQIQTNLEGLKMTKAQIESGDY